MPPVELARPAPEVKAPPFTPRDFRDAMGRFATGVVVISTESDGQAHAMTANAFMSGSLEPPLVIVSVANTARMHERIRNTGEFAISVLTQSQHAVSAHFAGKPSPDHSPSFERLDGLPVVAGATVQLTSVLRHEYACGDHTLFVAEVRTLRTVDAGTSPLLFHCGRYGRIAAPDWSEGAMPEGFWAVQEMRW